MDGNSPSRTSSRLKRGQQRDTDKIYANIDVLQVDQEGHGGLRHKYQVSKYLDRCKKFWILADTDPVGMRRIFFGSRSGSHFPPSFGFENVFFFIS
jgi:hypothetical protein